MYYLQKISQNYTKQWKRACSLLLSFSNLAQLELLCIYYCLIPLDNEQIIEDKIQI